MQSRHKFVGIGTIVVVLFVFGVSQSGAQSSLTLEGLSARITSLTQMVSALTRDKADRSEVRELETRVSALEARFEDTRPDPTATRLRPTSTPTPTRSNLRPNATSTPVAPRITTTRPMNIRSGPSTNYGVVGYADGGEKFLVTGQNSGGTWWRIEFEGQDAWIYAAYVTASNTSGIQVVATPSALIPTPSPTPNTTDLVNWAYYVAAMDNRAIGEVKDWQDSSQADKAAVVEVLGKFLIVTSDYCDLTIVEIVELMDKYGERVEQAGYSLRNRYAPRTNLMYELIQYAEDNPRRNSCDQLLEWRVILLLDS